MTDEEGRISNIYHKTDGSGLVERTSLGTGGSEQDFFNYIYNDFGWVTRITDGNSIGVEYQYGDQDAPTSYNAGELSKVFYDNQYGNYSTNPSNRDSEEFEYFRNGLIHHWINPRGDDIEYAYNDNGQVEHVYVTPSGGSQYEYAEYTYDLAGRLLTAERKDSAGSRVKNTYTYDSTSKRLTDETVRFYKQGGGTYDRTMSFTYNDDGTRASRADSFTSITLLYEYDDAGRLTLLSEEQQRFGMSMMSSYPAGVIARWDYDGAGRLAHQKYNSDKLVTTYTYRDFIETTLELVGHGFLEDAETIWDPMAMAGGHPNLYSYCGNDPVDAIDPDGFEKLIVAYNGDQTAFGTHLLIGLVDASGTITWYGFYPRPPGGGGKSKKHGTGGVGYVAANDRPDPKSARGTERQIGTDDYNALKATIMDSKGQYDKGKGKPYDLQNYNCSTWADEMISTALPKRIRPSTKRVATPRSVHDRMISDGDFRGGGSWSPGGN